MARVGTLNKKGMVETYTLRLSKETGYSEVNYKKYDSKDQLTESIFIEYFTAVSGKKDSSVTYTHKFKYDEKGNILNEYKSSGDVQNDCNFIYDDNSFLKTSQITDIKAQTLKQIVIDIEYKFDEKNNITEMTSKNGKALEKVVKRKLTYF
jgi:hypothetical protein